MSFTPDQIAQLSAPLSSAAVKQREQGGGKVSYIEGYHAENEANRIFGFDAWDRETVEVRKVAENARKIGRGQYEKDGWGVSYIAKVRITVLTPGGQEVVREGVGAGHGIDADLGQAHESAIKEAETDAEKRALKTFGNPFGQALYDKTHSQVADPEPVLTAASTAAIAAIGLCQSVDELTQWSATNKSALDNMGDADKAAVRRAYSDRKGQFAPAKAAA